MDTIEMLNRIKRKDFNAYCQLQEDYGWELYSRIRDRFDDKEKASQVFQETLSDFCSDLTGNEGNDAIESLLLAYAEKVCGRMERTSEQTVESAPPVVEIPKALSHSAPEEKEKPAKRAHRSGSFGFGLCVVILLVGMAAALWIILGLLMDMQFLPQMDLGYSWFNMNIAPWF